MQNLQQSKLNVLLEEIENEIKSIEKKNREAYASAIDIEDEEISLKTQAESYKAIRKMKGLKSALETFKSELEKSGIMSSLDKSLDKSEDKSDKKESVFIDHDRDSIVMPADALKDTLKETLPGER